MPGDFRINFGFFQVRIQRPTSVIVTLGPTLTRSFVINEGTNKVDINLGDNQFTSIHIHGLDAAKLEGSFVNPPAWTVDDPSIVTITPDASGTNCRVEAAIPAKLGTTVVKVVDSDDSTLDPLVFNVTVAAEAITSLGATVDPPEERPPAPPNP